MTTSNMRCSLSRLFPGAMVARSGKEGCDGSGTINVWLYLTVSCHVAHMVSRWVLRQRYRKVISVAGGFDASHRESDYLDRTTCVARNAQWPHGARLPCLHGLLFDLRATQAVRESQNRNDEANQNRGLLAASQRRETSPKRGRARPAHAPSRRHNQTLCNTFDCEGAWLVRWSSAPRCFPRKI
jgi:hypothetical protein